MKYLFHFRVSPEGEIVDETDMSSRPDSFYAVRKLYDMKIVPVSGRFVRDMVVYIEMEVV